MSKLYCGIDNGVSGSIGIITESDYFLLKTPTKSQQNYTKKKANITRIDIEKLDNLFFDYVFKNSMGGKSSDIMILIERPMVNPGRFKATTSALRAMEATIVFLEHHNLAYDWIDSKEWQKALLSKGAKGEELKQISADIGKRLFPNVSSTIDKLGDADGILIAEYCRRKF